MPHAHIYKVGTAIHRHRQYSTRQNYQQLHGLGKKPDECSSTEPKPPRKYFRRHDTRTCENRRLLVDLLLPVQYESLAPTSVTRTYRYIGLGASRASSQAVLRKQSHHRAPPQRFSQSYMSRSRYLSTSSAIWAEFHGLPGSKLQRTRDLGPKATMSLSNSGNPSA